MRPVKRAQCTAKNRKGNRCGGPAIPGGTVCRLHGGAAPQVRAKAQERLADLIDPDRALREAAMIAYADIRKCYDACGQLLPVADWPDDVAAAISGMKTTIYNRGSGDGKQEEVVEIKRWDKVRALEMMFKHLGLLKEHVEVSGQIDIVSKLEERKARAAALRKKKGNGNASG